MAYTPREIKDRVAVGDDIFIVEDLGNNRIKLIPDPTHVSEPGTPVNKALLQPIEDYLATGVVPVERTITAGNGLTGGGDLSANRTLSLGTPGTLSGATSNNVTDTSHTHAISVATQAEAEEGTNNIKLMTPLRVAEAFNNRVVFARVSKVSLDGGTIIRQASSPTDHNTIKFTTLLDGKDHEWFDVIFPSLGDVVVGTPQYALSTSPTLSDSGSLRFYLFQTRIAYQLSGILIHHGIQMVRPDWVSFLLVRSSGTGALTNIYLHFRFTGLKLA